MSSLSICAILLTVFNFSTYVVNKHPIIYIHGDMYLKLTTISVYMEGNEISQTQMKIMKKYEYNKSLLDVLPQVCGFV